MLNGMLEKGKSFVSGYSLPSLIIPLVAFALLAFGAADVFADFSPEEVEFDEIVSFGDIFDTIRTTVSTIVAGAIGLGLAIWGARYVFHIIKSMGR